MSNYNPELLEKIAENCPEFESAYDSPFAGAGSLHASRSGTADCICSECTHWNQGSCEIFLKHKD
ncbi:MAG: hypothetical protein ACOCZM_01640 [Bacillota bacterium]